MNGTLDTDLTDDARLDPQLAARLLRESGQNAKREVEFDPPWLSGAAALLILVLYGGLYMASRGEHPYTGPRGPWLLVLVAVLLVGLPVQAARFGGMAERLNGVTVRNWRLTWAVFGVSLVTVYVLDAALKHAGVGRGVVYGVLDACAPILVIGSAVAASSVWREDWPAVGVGVALMIVAAGAGFAGPAGAWGVIAAGGCLVMLAHGCLRLWLVRHDR